MTVTLRVYDNLFQLLGTVPQATQVAWSRERDGVGAGQFTVASDTPGLTESMLRPDNLVVVDVDGVDQFGWVVGRRGRVRGDAYDEIQVQGRGVGALLDRVVTYPQGGRFTLVPHDARLFGWQSSEFVDDGPLPWAQVGASELGGPVTTEGFVATIPEAFEVYTSGERNLYRRVMEGLPAEVPARMLLAAIHGTEVLVYLDGVQVMHRRPSDRGLIQVDIPYPAYDTQLAVEVRPGPYFASGRWGWAWVETALPAGEGDEPEMVGNIRRTYDPDDPGVPVGATPWLSYAGNQPYPGVSAGFVLSTLFAEAQGRSMLVPFTADFDAVSDSAGNPWPTTVELSVAVGDSLLSVVGALRDLGVEVEVTPGLVLRAWHGRGAVKPASFPLGLVRDVSWETEDEVYTHLLARAGREWVERSTLGGWQQVVEARREGFVALGDVPSWESAERVLDEVLGEMGEPAVQVGWTVNSAQAGCPTPLVDFDLGDTVEGPWIADMLGVWAVVGVRVDSVGAAVDDVGDVDWVLRGRRA